MAPGDGLGSWPRVENPKRVVRVKELDEIKLLVARVRSNACIIIWALPERT